MNNLDVSRAMLTCLGSDQLLQLGQVVSCNTSRFWNHFEANLAAARLVTAREFVETGTAREDYDQFLNNFIAVKIKAVHVELLKTTILIKVFLQVLTHL